MCDPYGSLTILNTCDGNTSVTNFINSASVKYFISTYLLWSFMSTNNSFTCGVWADTIVAASYWVKLVECERLGLKVRFERDTSLRISPSDLSPPPPFTFVERRRRWQDCDETQQRSRDTASSSSSQSHNHIAEVHFGSGSGRITLYNNPVSHKLNQFYILFMLLNIKYKMEGLSRAIM
jgi:hypothetical protein